MAYAYVDSSTGVATIGAGSRLGPVALGLWEGGQRAMPVGTLLQHIWSKLANVLFFSYIFFPARSKLFILQLDITKGLTFHPVELCRVLDMS